MGDGFPFLFFLLTIGWHKQQRSLGVTWGMLAFCSLASAQSDSSFFLPQVQVLAPAARMQPVGARVEQLDSARLTWHASENAAEVLIRRSGFYVRNYGPGSLATTSARGGSSAQTAVVWNGLPLQSPMLGQLDFALLPAFFSDDMAIQYGTSTAAWGSGAVGGALLLNNTSNWKPGLSVSTRVGMGSFGWRQTSSALRYGRTYWASSTRLFIESAQNDFLYRPAPTLPYQRQTNAQLQQQAALQEFFFRTRPQGATLVVRSWWQNTFRQIPPTITQRRSEAEQGDAAWRTALHWRKPGQRGFWEIRAAHFEESIRYRDPLLLQDTRSVFRTQMGEAETILRVGKRWRHQTSLTYVQTQARTPAYGSEARQWRAALFSSWMWQTDRWRAQIDARVEQIDGHWAPFIPGMGVECQLNSHWHLRARAARHYRAPTLNDRFWLPGGNPNLRPENGWSQEIGTDYRKEKGAWRYYLALTAFQRRIYDWILWARQVGQPFFSPQNIAEVWSRGAESRGEVQYIAPWGLVQWGIGYDYVRSTHERPVVNPRIEKGSQLFYVPKHRVFGEILGQWRRLQLIIFYQYTGAVIGLNERVPAFNLTSVRAQYVWQGRTFQGGVFGQIENVWNTSYFVVERRPMPGRHFRVGSHFRLQ